MEASCRNSTHLPRTNSPITLGTRWMVSIGGSRGAGHDHPLCPRLSETPPRSFFYGLNPATEAPATARRSRHEILVRGKEREQKEAREPPSRDVGLIRPPPGAARSSIRNPLSSRPLFPDGFSRAFRRWDRIRGPNLDG